MPRLPEEKLVVERLLQPVFDETLVGKRDCRAEEEQRDENAFHGDPK
jgi:hypothetical protein